MFFRLPKQTIDKPRNWPGIGLTVLLLAGCSESTPPSASVGSRFPLDALMQTTDLGTSRTALEGRTLVINFWATWCAPCREEMPMLQQLSDRLDPNRFAVIGVSVDDDTNLVREFLLRHDIRFHSFQDRGMRLARETLGIVAYPQTFIVTPRGLISDRIDGAISSERVLLDAIAGSAPSNSRQPVSG